METTCTHTIARFTFYISSPPPNSDTNARTHLFFHCTFNNNKNDTQNDLINTKQISTIIKCKQSNEMHVKFGLDFDKLKTNCK